MPRFTGCSTSRPASASTENPFNLACEKAGTRDGSVNQLAISDFTRRSKKSIKNIIAVSVKKCGRSAALSQQPPTVRRFLTSSPAFTVNMASACSVSTRFSDCRQMVWRHDPFWKTEPAGIPRNRQRYRPPLSRNHDAGGRAARGGLQVGHVARQHLQPPGTAIYQLPAWARSRKG